MSATATLSVLPSPPLFNATPDSLLKDAETIVSNTRNVWKKLASTVQPADATFRNTVLPVIQNANDESTKRYILGFYGGMHPSTDLRDAADKASVLFTSTDVEIYGSSDYFRLVDAVMRNAKHGSGDMDPESRNYLDKLHQKFKHNGCSIEDPDTKAQFAAAKKQHSEKMKHCNRNLDENKSGVWFTLEELVGVPQSWITRFKKGSDAENEDLLWVSTKVATSGAVLKYAGCEETRRKLFYAGQNSMPDNVDAFRDIILLRDQTARMLGYPNHAALKTSEKMTKTPDFVANYLAEIKEQLVPRGREEMMILQSFKNADGSADAQSSAELFFWDQSYCARIQAETQRDPEDELREYFELQTTLRKLLGMFEHLFGTRFERITNEQQIELGHGEPMIWHKDVQMYRVWDEDTATQRLLGYAYFDFYSRDGKYGHNGHYSMQRGFQQADGTRFLPSSAVMFNYHEPLLTGEPTLLSLEDIRKLFHEIGHLIHAMCIETKYSASCYIDRDFVEAPSLMFEQFFWQERHVIDVSCHYSYLSPAMQAVWRSTLPEGERTTSQQPPRQLSAEAARSVTQIDRGSNVRKELHNIFFATYDLAVHTPDSHEELERTNLTELFNKTRVEIMSLHGGEAIGDGWEWGHGETIFRNILNNYDAGYYAYNLGRLLALDLFKTGFEADTMSKEAGRKYRDLMLRPGGSVPEMETLKTYLGREPSTVPYFEWLGIERGSGKTVL